MERPLIIALRGSLHQAPENTLPAIQKAVAAQVDVVALEVQASKDEQPVVMADSRLDRTTNGTGRVNRLSLQELRELDAGSWAGSEFTGTCIPTLGEALAALGDGVGLMLTLPEVRPGSGLGARIAADLAVRKNPEADVLVFTDSESMGAFRELAPRFRYALALDEKVDGWVVLRKAEKLNCQVVRPYRAQVNSDFVRKAHEKGLKVYVHFADEESDLRDLLGNRVDGIVTGRPERMRSLLEQAGKSKG